MSDEGAMSLLDLITALWLASVGASVGSFVNVVAYRLPLGASLVWIPSRCPACGYPIRLRDNIPMFGWLLLGGRCRDCGVRISPRYFFVEAAMAAAFFTLAYVELFSGGANLPDGPLTSYTGAWGTIWHPEWELIGVYFYHCAVLSVLMAIALVDLDGQRVPWSLFAFGICLSLVAKYAMPEAHVSGGSHLFERAKDNPVLAAGVGAVFGAVWGSLLSLASIYSVGPNDRKFDRSRRGGIAWNARFAFSMSICGSLIGVSSAIWLALSSLWCGIWLVLFLLFISGARRTCTGIVLALWPATLSLLIWWKPLFEFFQRSIVANLG